MSEANQTEVAALTQAQETSFSFRQNKETGVKRDTVVVTYQIPTSEGIIAALNSGDANQVSLITDTIAEIIKAQVRNYVDADPEFNQEKIDTLAEQLTLQAIANLPRAERNTVGKDDLEQFAKDYITVMPGITGKDEQRVSAAAALFVERFKRVAGQNEILTVLQDQLQVFAEKADEEVINRNIKAVTYFYEKLKELLALKITADAL